MVTATPSGRPRFGSRQDIESELDAILAALGTLYAKEPDEAMRVLSAAGARLTELAVFLHRAERSQQDEYRQVRTMQVEKMIAALDLQFRIASRLLEARRQDLEMLNVG